MVKLILTRKDNKVYSAVIASVKGNLEVLGRQVNKMHRKEKSRFNKFEYDQRKQSYLLGRLSAKQAIMGLTRFYLPKKIFIDSGVFLFPIVRNKKIPNTQVSITHCDDIGISIAFDESHPMGIDVERIKMSSKEALIKQITTTESELLKSISLQDIAGYTIIWSIKESLSKVLKTGMMLDFTFFEINSIEEKKHIIETTFRHFGQYKTLSFFNKNYVISITLPRNTEGNFTPVWKILDAI